MSNPEGPHFHAGMAALAKYMQHMFNLHASTAMSIIQHRLHLGLLEQHVEELRRANAILRSGTPPPSDQDHELQVAVLLPTARHHARDYGRAHARDHTPRAPRRAAGP
jgi:hypothetical protein